MSLKNKLEEKTTLPRGPFPLPSETLFEGAEFVCGGLLLLQAVSQPKTNLESLCFLWNWNSNLSDHLLCKIPGTFTSPQLNYASLPTML